MLTNLLTPLAHKALLAALVIIALLMWRADRISADRDKLRNLYAASEANHSITRGSLAALERELGLMVKDGTLRADRLRDAMEAQIGASQALQDQADRIMTEGATDACVTPGAVMGAGL